MRVKPKKSKFDAVKNHFKMRMLQRFGIDVTQAVLDDLFHQVRSGAATRLQEQSRTKVCYKVSCEGREIAVVYNYKYKTFSTAMPLEWIGNDRNMAFVEALTHEEY